MLISTTPNKETIRRICILNGATTCYLYTPEDTPKVMLVIDIKDDKVNSIEEELKSWCGMPFKVYSSLAKCEQTHIIQQHGVKILPIY